MKRITMLLMVVLASVCFSAADTITLNDGEGEMFGFATAFPTYHFVFVGGSSGIEIDRAFGDYPFTAGLQNCLSCDPRGLFEILFDSGTGVDHFGRIFAGLMEFDAVSFVSSLAPNGMLTVIYTASARMDFHFCSDVENCFGDVLVWNPKRLWLVTAQFTPDPSRPDTWEFVDATFTPAPTPEPSSMFLMASGLVVVTRKARRTRGRFWLARNITG